MPTIQTFDLNQEQCLSARQAACVATGDFTTPVSPQTIKRWITLGEHPQGRRTLPRVQLEGGYLGRRLVTSREALQRFMEKLSNPPELAPVRPQPQASAAALAASERLRLAGFMNERTARSV